MNINFLGLGVQKAGTSTLHDILKQHSEIYLPESKEAHFFDLSDKYNNGYKWLTETHFQAYKSQKIVGKFTPEYLYMDKSPQRIFETLGKNIKFIIVFRHPVDRAVSHYNMIYRRGIEKLDFFTAVNEEHKRINESEWNKIQFSYMDRGMYSEQLKRYLEIFPAENFLYLFFETDIVKNMEQTINKVQAFLNVDHEQLNVNLKSNEAYEPYSIKLNQLARESNLLTKGAKIIFPSTVRLKLKELFFSKLNKKSKSKPLFILTKEDRAKYFDDFFLADVKKLESLININLNGVWYHDNNKI